MVHTGQFLMLFQARKSRHEMSSPTDPATSDNDKEKQVTKMLVTLAILFVIFKIPYTLVYYLHRLHEK